MGMYRELEYRYNYLSGIIVKMLDSSEILHPRNFLVRLAKDTIRDCCKPRHI